MYCIHCGKQIGDGDQFCEFCGRSQVEEVVVEKPAQGNNIPVNSVHVPPVESSAETGSNNNVKNYLANDSLQNKTDYSSISAEVKKTTPPKPAPKIDRQQEPLPRTNGNIPAGKRMIEPAYINEPTQKPVARTVMFVLLFLAVIGAGVDAYLYYFWQ